MCQLFLHLDGEDGVVGLSALLKLLQQLPAIPEVRQLFLEGWAAAGAAVRGVAGLLGRLRRMVDIKALVLEELDDGELGQVQLGRQRVNGLLIRIQAHVLDEALEDAQGLQGDLPSARASLGMGPSTAALVLGLRRGGCGGLARGQPGAHGQMLLRLLLHGLLGQQRLGGMLERHGGLVVLMRLGGLMRLGLQQGGDDEETRRGGRRDGGVNSKYLSAAQ